MINLKMRSESSPLNIENSQNNANTINSIPDSISKILVKENQNNHSISISNRKRKCKHGGFFWKRDLLVNSAISYLKTNLGG